MRPVLVKKKSNRRIFLALPFSTQMKAKPYYHRFIFRGKEQSIILSQLNLRDSKRLEDKKGALHPGEFQQIKNRLQQHVVD